MGTGFDRACEAVFQAWAEMELGQPSATAWANVPPSSQEQCRKWVRAVLEAVREPGFDAISAGRIAARGAETETGRAARAYVGILDALLAQAPPKA